MIGIEFEIDNEYGIFLSKILSNINTANSKWYLSLEEAYDKEGDFFQKEVYEDSYFREKIQKDHYIIHFIGFCFSDGNITEINNYNDYLDSSCNIVISIIDSTIVKIYSKEASILKTIEENAKNNNFTNINYIYSKNNYQEYFKYIIMAS